MQIKAPTFQELIADFNSANPHLRGKKLKFSLGEDLDVYNITAPFEINGKTYVAGRVEKREEFLRSFVKFFTPAEQDLWHVDPFAPVYKLEDPFITKINNELIFGGVQILDPDPKGVRFVTVFYKGTNFNNLKHFANGPTQMKDIRLAELPSGKIGVFTRPQGKIGGKGTIGYLTIPSLDYLNPENIMQAKLLEGHFAPDHWGGANEIHVLKDGTLGVLSHYAFASEDGNGYKRNYAATAFKYNPEKDEKTPLKVIATRSNFTDGPAKTPDLDNVVFSGGLVRLGNGQAYLYCGLSDAEAGVLTIRDPFD